MAFSLAPGGFCFDLQVFCCYGQYSTHVLYLKPIPPIKEIKKKAKERDLGITTYCTYKRRLVALQIASAPPTANPTAASLPSPFIGLGKFVVRRLHQIRAQKCYLATHRSWFDQDEPNSYPRCYQGDQNFEHTLLKCATRVCDENLPLKRSHLLTPVPHSGQTTPSFRL